jgi:hypothetical protein
LVPEDNVDDIQARVCDITGWQACGWHAAPAATTGVEYHQHRRLTCPTFMCVFVEATCDVIREVRGHDAREQHRGGGVVGGVCNVGLDDDVLLPTLCVCEELVQ